MNHCDILWVDDFDTSDNIADSELVTNDTSDTATFKNELNDYYPTSYHFRVNIYKYFLKLLLHLEDDFSQYNCVVLDINLGKGIWRSRKPSVLPCHYEKNNQYHNFLQFYKNNYNCLYYLVFYELMVILKCALLLNLYIAHDGAHHQACVYGVYGGREVSWLIAGFASRSTAMAPQIPLAQLTPIAHRIVDEELKLLISFIPFLFSINSEFIFT